MKLLRLFAILFMPAIAAAQFTTVTGTVTDPNGLAYADGTIVATLVIPSGAGSPTLSGGPYSPPSGPSRLDKAGKFTIRLGDNTVLLPASTQWTFLICSGRGTIQPAGGNGPVCFTVPALTISGSSQSITSNITAVPPPALSLNPGTGTLTSVACTAPLVCAPSPIVSSGTASCPTCAIGPGASTANHAAGFASTDGLTLEDLGVPGTVTNTSGTLTLNCVLIGNGTNDLKCTTNTTDNGTTFTTTDTGGFLGPLFSTATTHPAASGVLRMANTECIGWRNAGNSADITMCTDATGNIVPTGTTGFGSASNRWAIVGTNGNFSGNVPVSGTLSYNQQNNINSGHALSFTTAPTILAAGCGGSGASISSQNGSSAFRVNVGTSNTGTCTITMGGSTASTGFNCHATDLTTKSTTVAQTLQTSASSATQIVLQNYTDVMATGAWTDSDTLSVQCTAE